MESIIAQITAMGSTFWTTVGIIVFLLLCSAFFSGSETALTAASRGKLRSLADKGSRGAARALALKEDNERLIGGILLGNNLVNTLATAIATALLTTIVGDGAIVVATILMTAMVLIFSEVLPKTYAISNAEVAASRVASAIGLVVTLLAPIVATVQFIVRGLLRLVGAINQDDNGFEEAQAEIAGAIALGHSEGSFEKEDRDRLLGALDLGEREVEEIMLHRSDIEMIDADADPQDILSKCLNSRYTRLPIFKDDPENIVGVVHAKDLLRHVDKLVRDAQGNAAGLSKLKILDVASKPYFVPETTPLDDQMREFLRRKAHFALVVDEYGALQGLITLEDILEEIVGEITDEYDEEEEKHDERDAFGNFEIDGAATIRDVNRQNDWDLPDEEANTIAGLVIHEAQLIPTVGQIFSFYGFRFEIAEREGNRITKLKIRPL